jgi:phenylacetate-coenzyme A ligase PaaK-like adenylate-forming protein
LSSAAGQVLDAPFGEQLDPDEFIRAAMHWHFDPQTGSPYWLRRAETLEFDPRVDVRGYEDLKLFPSVADEFRDVRAEDLVPRGYGRTPAIAGVFESGGTTGAPKRVVCLHDWLERLLAWDDAQLDAHGFPREVNWLAIVPTGPHVVGELVKRSAVARGGLAFLVDLDPRWVRGLIAAGRSDEADAYAEHVIDQAACVLRTQDVGVLTITPPLLERLARRDELVDLVNAKVRAIRWGGTQLDADSRYLYRSEVFPDVVLSGHYGSTMILGFASQRPGLGDGGPCVFDALAPQMTYSIVDPSSGDVVDHGERGQVVMSHVSKSFLLPNNPERDMAVRVRPPEGQAGDSVADVGPAARFEGESVIEGVY